MTPRKTGHSMNRSCCAPSDGGARDDDGGVEEETIRNESSSSSSAAAAAAAATVGAAVVPIEAPLESTAVATQSRNHRPNAVAPFHEAVHLSRGRRGGEESKEEKSSEFQQTTSLLGEESKEEIVELATTQMAMIADSAEEAAAVWVPDDNIEASTASLQNSDDLAALKRAAYRGQSSDGGSSVSDRDQVGQQATVVAISEASALHHSGELATGGTVHAELVGQDFSSVAPTDAQGEDSSYVDPLQQQATVPITTEEQTTEATVIDSEPLQQLNNQEVDELLAWKTEEAQVVSDNSSGAGRKVAAEDDVNDDNFVSATGNEQSSHGEARDRIDSVIADQVAEVVYVQEEVHPDEFLDNDAEAELVGTDASAVATVYEQQRDGAEGTTLTNSVVASDQQAEVVGQESVHWNEYVHRSTDVAESVGGREDCYSQDAPSAERVVNAEQIGINEPQAEVLDIHEGAHPNEFAGESAAQAQFVGPDLATNVAAVTLPSQDQNNTAEAVVLEEAMVIGASTTPRAPAHAEAYSITSVDKPPPSQSAANVAVLPATTAVEEDLLYPQKGPAGSRSVSWENGVATAPLDEEVYSEEVDRPEWLRDTPPPQTPLASTNPEASASSTSNVSASSQRLQMISTNLARSTTNVMEALFGDSSPPFLNRRGRSSTSEIAECIMPRKLLPWSVIYSPPTKMWVATLQTNQKALDKNNITEASKSLRAFSLPSEKSAVALAKAWTPPRMMAFSDYQMCHICSSRFALLRRPCHCRNCGVVICKECSVPWPAKMIPDTYNFKKESIVNVCLSCNWLSNQFRLALLNGNQDQAVAVAATGNINLHAPFANVKGELFYPVHCAALGGSLPLLKWLVDENCCPIKSLRVSGGGASGTYTPIVTSKGRSLLGIAMENRSIDIVRYLVVKKGISLAGEKDITFELLLRNLDKVLRLLPEDVFGVGKGDEADAASGAQEEDVDLGMVSSIYPRSFDDQENGRSLSDGARNLGATENDEEKNDCIICFDSPIDCVTVPCGHQICCLKCSKHISRCPVCSMNCTFMRVFKP